MSDLLRLDYINSLPQPFTARLAGGDDWEVDLICVETGGMTINVCGLCQNTHIGEVLYFLDADGTRHDSDSFYSDYLDYSALDVEIKKEPTQ
jgi:hypothetical protein